MRRHTIYTTLAGLFLFGTLPLLIGACGSSGTVPATTPVGRASLIVRWPERGDSRLIPFAANSIRVRVLKGTSELGTALLVRPTDGGKASASFDRLPVGDVTVTATAYPGNDGTGVGQASAQTTVTIVAGQTVPVPLTLASAIAKIEVTPSPVALNSGQTAQLIATAKNAAGEIVLTQGATIEWTSKNTSVATVEPGGLVRAVAGGSAVIEAKETESGKSGAVTVTVDGTGGGGGGGGNGTLIVYEGFDYAAGATLVGLNGGTGWSAGWTEHGQGNTPSVIAANGLTFTGLKTSGRALQTTSRRPVGNNRALIEQLSSYATDGSVLYASMLIRPLDPMNAGSPDTYFGYGPGGVSVLKPGRSVFYGMEGPVYNITDTNVRAEQGITVFLVLRVTFQNGPDVVDMWVNPTPGQPLPTPHATRLQDMSFGNSEVGIGSSISCLFDEYRIGTSWEVVAPTGP